MSLIFKWTGGKHESFDSLCNEISVFKGRRAAREGGEGWMEGNVVRRRKESRNDLCRMK